MDHEAFENEMIDTVNRHSGEWDQLSFDGEFPEPIKKHKFKVFSKEDASALKTGLVRVLAALCTAFLFGLSVFAFIATATATGYWAVILFLAAIVLMVFAFIFLYAQGISPKGTGGQYETK